MWRLIVFSLLAATTARAATFDVLSLGPNKPSLVTVSGTFDFNDKDVFLRKIGSLSGAIVAFDSEGGSLVAGIQIGEIIRLKNFTTVVLDQTRCASSCALAWLGGTKRFMGSTAQIGFHAAYNGETRQVTSTGNALVGAYLNKIGLPYSAVVYITTASPDSITWLSKSDAEKLGIEVSFFNGTPNTKSRDNASATGAYVVQVSSQRSDTDARAAFRVLQAKYPMLLASYLPMIYRSDLGDKGVFYRAAVGPFQTPEEASQFCGDLKTAGGQCVVQRNTAADVAPPKEPPKAANAPQPPERLVLPIAISPKYSTENDGEARMHTCLDQYIANKASNGNGGMKWIDKGGGYYSECNKKLKG
jgi:sporulation related protein